MGLLSRKLRLLARFAAVTTALLALPAVAGAGPAVKPAAHGHKPAGKRAAVSAKPTPDRARAAAPKAVSKDVKAGTKPAAAAVKAAKLGKQEPNVPASSVGAPNEGKLVGGVKLDTSSGAVRVVPAYQRGDTRWGLPALVHMIERSAKKVAKKHPGSVLGVGDISRKNGGDIFLHRSHESGRDADIAFYVVDQKGKNLLPETFVTFQGSVESSSMPGARFDVAKNWALVQAMLEDPVARVSHIFVADPLRRMLLAYAKPRVLPALYNRAAAVMMQPSNALPHDNHFHVRISCPAHMKKSCVEYPAGVFKTAKKGKNKLVTPHGKQTAAQATALHKPTSAPKPGAHAGKTAHKPKAQGVAAAPKLPAAKPLGAAPRKAPVEHRVASADNNKKKPIYLQSAVANEANDPLDRVLFSVPALSHLGGSEPDNDAGEAEVKAAVDDTGTVKITE